MHMSVCEYACKFAQAHSAQYDDRKVPIQTNTHHNRKKGVLPDATR